jgi:hypothetical protein
MNEAVDDFMQRLSDLTDEFVADNDGTIDDVISALKLTLSALKEEARGGPEP